MCWRRSVGANARETDLELAQRGHGPDSWWASPGTASSSAAIRPAAPCPRRATARMSTASRWASTSRCFRAPPAMWSTGAGADVTKRLATPPFAGSSSPGSPSWSFSRFCSTSGGAQPPGRTAVPRIRPDRSVGVRGGLSCQNGVTFRDRCEGTRSAVADAGLVVRCDRWGADPPTWGAQGATPRLYGDAHAWVWEAAAGVSVQEMRSGASSGATRASATSRWRRTGLDG